MLKSRLDACFKAFRRDISPYLIAVITPVQIGKAPEKCPNDKDGRRYGDPKKKEWKNE
jgi:hypothetical protein